MARKPRIEFPNALYHIIARGNRRHRIFLESRDYQKYLALLARYKKRDNFKLYAYALMANHVHLLIETASVPLSKTMQCLQQTYTQYFNWKHEEVGHLFQGRYKAILCEKDSYLLELVRYIHCNPVRAGIVRKLSDYLWTGHRHYIKERRGQLLDTDYVLAHFSQDRQTAKLAYKQFVEDRMDQRLQVSPGKPIDSRILGGSDFVKSVLQDQPPSKDDQKESGERLSLEQVVDMVSRHCGVVPGAVKSNLKSRDIVAARRLLIYLARVRFGYSLKETAQFLKIDPTTVTKSVLAISNQLKKKKGIDQFTVTQILQGTTG